MEITKGYKAFNADMTCLGKQYAENTTYEEDSAELCKKGMHFCVNPLDCLDYYALIDKDGKKVLMAEVEGEDAITDDGKKYCTKKLHVKKIISVEDAMRAYADGAKNSADWKNASIGGYRSKAIGGDGSKAIGGYRSQAIGGDGSQAIGDDWSQAIGGDWSQAIGGYGSQAIGGDGSKAIGGYRSQAIGGNGSLVVCGYGSVVKLGMYSIAVGYDYGNGIQQPPVTIYIDGENYKADTKYRFDGEKWAEVSDDDA